MNKGLGEITVKEVYLLDELLNETLATVLGELIIKDKTGIFRSLISDYANNRCTNVYFRFHYGKEYSLDQVSEIMNCERTTVARQCKKEWDNFGRFCILYASEYSPLKEIVSTVYRYLYHNPTWRASIERTHIDTVDFIINWKMSAMKLEEKNIEYSKEYQNEHDQILAEWKEKLAQIEAEYEPPPEGVYRLDGKITQEYIKLERHYMPLLREIAKKYEE